MIRFERDEGGNACISEILLLQCCMAKQLYFVSPCCISTFWNTPQASQQVHKGDRYSYPLSMAWSLAVPPPPCNFQLECRRVLGFVLLHFRSSAADSLKCRWGDRLHLFFQLGVSSVLLASAVNFLGEVLTSERSVWKVGGRSHFPWCVTEMTEHSYWTWKIVK